MAPKCREHGWLIEFQWTVMRWTFWQQHCNEWNFNELSQGVSFIGLLSHIIYLHEHAIVCHSTFVRTTFHSFNSNCGHCDGAAHRHRRRKTSLQWRRFNRTIRCQRQGFCSFNELWWVHWDGSATAVLWHLKAIRYPFESARPVWFGSRANQMNVNTRFCVPIKPICLDGIWLHENY